MQKMIKFEKSKVKWISVIIAVVFMGSVVALALTQSSSGIASAASSSNVGVIDYNQVIAQHPKLQESEEQMKQAVADAQRDFEVRSADMGDQEKQDYYIQTQQRLQQKNQELLTPLRASVETAVKEVANNRGLSIVIDKGAVVYGGMDITQDVIKKLSK